jgi:hypothetical protein
LYSNNIKKKRSEKKKEASVYMSQSVEFNIFDLHSMELHQELLGVHVVVDDNNLLVVDRDWMVEEHNNLVVVVVVVVD